MIFEVLFHTNPTDSSEFNAFFDTQELHETRIRLCEYIIKNIDDWKHQNNSTSVSYTTVLGWLYRFFRTKEVLEKMSGLLEKCDCSSFIEWLKVSCISRKNIEYEHSFINNYFMNNVVDNDQLTKKEWLLYDTWVKQNNFEVIIV